MSDNSGNGGFVLHCVSGCYAEVHISEKIRLPKYDIPEEFNSFWLILRQINCLEIPLVIGYSLVPEPPVSTIPFMCMSVFSNCFKYLTKDNSS